MKGQEILAHDPTRTNNATLMQDCAALGYIHGEVWDPTWGLGAFWRDIDPAQIEGVTSFTATDIKPNAAWVKPLDVLDAETAWGSDAFDTIVFDPPYKLNGRPTAEVDDRYGVGERATTRERMSLILDGTSACASVLRPKGHLLVKCQDQIVSGSPVWQTHEVTNVAARWLLTLVDMLFVNGYRPQPAGRSQKHARRNYSTLLVFERKAIG